jgi:hypothetical protein
MTMSVQQAQWAEGNCPGWVVVWGEYHRTFTAFAAWASLPLTVEAPDTHALTIAIRNAEQEWSRPVPRSVTGAWRQQTWSFRPVRECARPPVREPRPCGAVGRHRAPRPKRSRVRSCLKLLVDWFGPCGALGIGGQLRAAYMLHLPQANTGSL